MKRNKLMLLSLPVLLIGACAKPATPTGSSSSSEIEDTRTTQEKVLDNIGDTFALTGDYTLGQIMQMPDFETGEMMSMDMEMGTSTYTTYLCPDYVSISQYIEEPEYYYDIRLDRGDDDCPVIYQLDPFQNKVVASSWTGDDSIKFEDIFGSPFENPEDFEVVEDTLVLKEGTEFDFTRLGYILTLGNRATTLRELTIEFDDDYKPTAFYADFVDDTNAQFGFEMYYKYSGQFIDPSAVHASPIPTEVPAQDGQAALEAKFASLRNHNFTAVTSIYDGESKITDATIMVNPTHAYFEYSNTNPEYSYMNFTSRGYFQNENGLNYYKLKEGVPTATSYPNEKYTYDNLVGNLWTVSGYVFNVNSDGSYTLPSCEYTVPVSGYLGTESIFVGGLQADKGSFKITLTDDGLEYSYTSDAQYTVVTKVSGIGSTTIPVDLAAFVEYSPATNILEWGLSQGIPEFDFVVNDITGNHPELIPFYEGTGRNDGFIDVGTQGMETFGAGFTISQQCTDEMEEMDLFMNFMNQLDPIEGYTYHFMEDEYEYGSEGDDVHFKISVTPGMYIGEMTGVMYEHAVTLKVINLATPEGWTNPWDEM